MKKNLVALILFCGIFATGVYAGETPRSTVQTLINCCKIGSVSGVKRQLHNGDQLGNGDNEGIAAMRIMFQGARVTSVENVGSRKAVVYVSIKDPSSGERLTIPITVEKINGDWLIVSQD